MTKFALLAALAGAAACPAIALADGTREAVAASAGAVVMTLHAIGAQVYECKADGHGSLAWSIREPIATLMRDGRTVGRHFAGPAWEIADGSSVIGKVVDKAPGESPDDIPWLKLAVAEHKGVGELAGVAVVQRIATVGGNKAGPCPAEGSIVAVPYTAVYVFSK